MKFTGFNTSEKVGIGLTSIPDAPLVVAGAAGSHQTIFRTNEAVVSQRAGGGFSSLGSSTAANRYARIFLDADGANFSGADYFTIEKFGVSHSSAGEVKLINYSTADISFWTPYTVRALTIKATTGRVGIGTTAPASGGVATNPKLHVNGATRLDGNVAIAPASATPYISAGTTGLQFRNNNNTATLLTILNDGKIGIGATSPTQPLEIFKAGNSTEMLVHAYGGTDNTTQAGIWFRTDNSNPSTYARSKGAVIFQRTGSYGVGKLHLAVQSNANSSSAAVGDAKLTIIQDGNVGIGTAAPKHTLEVNGGIVETGGVIKSNLLSNSGFDVWSQSTLENVTGTNLVSGWTNYSTNQYTTLTISGANITTAVGPSGTAYAISAAGGLTLGKLYKVVVNVTLTSGQLPWFFQSHIYASQGADFAATRLSAGANTFIYEYTQDTYDRLGFQNTNACNWSATIVWTEVSPGCVAADGLAFDGWYKDTAIDLYREHNGSNTKDGSFYSLKTVVGTAGHDLYAFGGLTDNADHYQRFAGRTVTFGAWAKTSTASLVKLRLDDGSVTDSAYCSNDGNWHWLEVTKTISDTPTRFKPVIPSGTTGTYYLSQPMVVFGSAIGEGNYTRPSGEIIYCEKAFASNKFYSNGHSDISATTMNLEADTNGRFPKGAKAFTFSCEIKDSASSTTDGYLYFRRDASSNVATWVSCYGLANDKYGRANGTAPCDANGDYSYTLEASGSDTADVWMSYVAVQLR